MVMPGRETVEMKCGSLLVPLHCLLSNNRFLEVILLNDGVEKEHSCQCFTHVNWLLIDLYFCMFLFLFYVHAHQIIQSATEP